MIIFRARSFIALPKVSYAFIASSNVKWWVINCLGRTLPDTTVFKSIGVVTVSTRRVVRVMLCDQSLSRFNWTGLPQY